MTEPQQPETSGEGDSDANIGSFIDLVDYRARVFAQYAAVRASDNPKQAWESWRRGRDDLFVHHSQSPIDTAAKGFAYRTPFTPYDPDFRSTVRPRAIGGEDLAMGHSDGSRTLFQPIADVAVSVPTGEFELTVYWLKGYGGGVFLPFRDATSGDATYGGGRYLLDTVKGADLGSEDGRIVLDFNYAYHPSCVYSPRWSCPLAPPQNRVAVPIPVGEQLLTAGVPD